LYTAHSFNKQAKVVSSSVFEQEVIIVYNAFIQYSMNCNSFKLLQEDYVKNCRQNTELDPND